MVGGTGEVDGGGRVYGYMYICVVGEKDVDCCLVGMN